MHILRQTFACVILNTDQSWVAPNAIPKPALRHHARSVLVVRKEMLPQARGRPQGHCWCDNHAFQVQGRILARIPPMTAPARLPVLADRMPQSTTRNLRHTVCIRILLAHIVRARRVCPRREGVPVVAGQPANQMLLRRLRCTFPLSLQLPQEMRIPILGLPRHCCDWRDSPT